MSKILTPEDMVKIVTFVEDIRDNGLHLITPEGAIDNMKKPYEFVRGVDKHFKQCALDLVGER